MTIFQGYISRFIILRTYQNFCQSASRVNIYKIFLFGYFLFSQVSNMPQATHKYKTFPLVLPTMYPKEGIAITEIAATASNKEVVAITEIAVVTNNIDVAIMKIVATASNIDVVATVPRSRNDHHPRSDHMSSTSKYKRLSRSRSPRHRSCSRRDISRERSATCVRHSSHSHSEGKCENCKINIKYTNTYIPERSRSRECSATRDRYGSHSHSKGKCEEF